MPEKIENFNFPNAAAEVEVFDFAALQQKFISDKQKGTLTALEEVELGFRIQAGEESSLLLAAAENSYVALDPGELEECQANIREGNLAFDIFIRGNEGMVELLTAIVLHKFAHLPRLEKDDLLQVANIHLIASAKKFDPALGIKFSSFAQTYIYRRLVSWARENGNLVQQSRGMADKVAEFRSLVEQGYGEEDAAAEIGYTLETLQRHEEAIKNPDAISYDRSYVEGEDSAPLIEVLDGPDEDIPHDEQVIDALSADIATAALREWIVRRAGSRGTDSERMFKIMVDYYVHERSYEAIGRKWGITGKRVSQIVKAARGLIKTQLPPSVARHIEGAGYSAEID
ncbi:MAG TPA: sigma-70 family RNA polymerase sigma factor [Candidatus Saccharimonadales bacterium]|nr:sigma-70 family RNA polymerase sigma factor [Candidatus Saccharimonadales bacterium]